MENNNLQIDIEELNNAQIIKPVGDIDLSKSADLRAVIKIAIESSVDLIVIDLQHVNYMDSSGVATLIEGLQLSRTIYKELVLCSLTKNVEAVIQLSKLDQIFDIYLNKDIALENSK